MRKNRCQRCGSIWTVPFLGPAEGTKTPGKVRSSKEGGNAAQPGAIPGVSDRWFCQRCAFWWSPGQRWDMPARVPECPECGGRRSYGRYNGSIACQRCGFVYVWPGSNVPRPRKARPPSRAGA